MKITSLLVVLLALGACEAASQGPERRVVSFCEVVRNPEQYDQKAILTSGVYKAGAELSDFFDPDCPATPERDVSTLFVPSEERVANTRSWKQMQQLLDKESRVFVVVRGTFDAYRRYEGPLPSDPRLQEVLIKGNSRFGHLNFARFRLRIESVEFAASASN
jgi:hypothetical protein